MKRNRRDNKAFTLIEVLLVLLILGMLAGVAIMAYGGTQKKAKIQTTKLKIKAIETALDRFNMDVGRYPTETEGLGVLVSDSGLDNDSDKTNWAGPYLKQMPKDAWGNDFEYAPVQEGESDVPAGTQYKVWSKGPNGQDGDDDDINSWQSPDQSSSSSNPPASGS